MSFHYEPHRQQELFVDFQPVLLHCSITVNLIFCFKLTYIDSIPVPHVFKFTSSTLWTTIFENLFPINNSSLLFYFHGGKKADVETFHCISLFCSLSCLPDRCLLKCHPYSSLTYLTVYSHGHPYSSLTYLTVYSHDHSYSS